MAVRQQEINSSMMSILKKMDVMLQSLDETSEKTLLIFDKIETIIKNEMVSELKNQTKELIDIKSLLAKNSINNIEPKKFKELLGGMAISLEKIIKAVSKLDDKSGDKIEKFFSKLENSLKNISNNVNEKTLKSISDILGSIGSSILKFGMSMVLYAIISPIAMIGSVMFGISIKLLMLSIGSINIKTSLALKPLLELGGAIIKFGLALVAYAIISPIAMIGAVIFGLTVRLLLLTSGSVGIKSSLALKSLLGLGEAVIKFGLALVAYAIISPIAMIGAVMFGLSVRLLLNSMGVSIKASLAMWSLSKLSKGILLFVLGMVVVTLLMPIVLIGIIILSTSLLILSLALYIMGSKRVKGGITGLLIASLAILAFGIIIKSYANDISIKDVFIVGISVAIIGIAFWLAGKMFVNIIKGAIAIGLASLVLIIISSSLVIFKSAKMTLEDSGILLLILGGTALIFGIAGAFFAPIALGAIAIGLSALAIWTMAMALKEFQTLKWTEKNSDNLKYTIKSVLSALSGTDEKKGIVANISGAAGQGLQAILSLLSIGPLLLGSAAIWIMSMALKQFKDVNWDQTQNTLLGDTITMVLNSLSGKSGNTPTPSITDNILNTIVSMFSAGALLVGSAAIWLLSEALIKFKDVKWDDTQNKALGDTITTVLSALRGETKTSIGNVNSGAGPLDAILSLMGAGALLFAAGSIWLLSEALIKFKDVKWDKPLTEALSYTISEITRVMTGAEKDEGILGSISSFAKSAIGAGTSVASATSLGISALAIMDLSGALKKWKGLGWGPGQTNNLTYTIDKILLSFKSTPEDGLYKVANNFDRIQSSMKLLKEHINSMDLQKLTLTDSMMKSIALLSKSPEAIGEKIAESIEKAFEDLAKAIKESTEDIKTAGEDKSIISDAANSIKGMFASKPDSAPMPAPQAAPPTQQITPQQLQQALTTALAAYFNSATIKIKEA